jgi:hypothetical protein
MMLQNYVYLLSISFSNYALLKTSFHSQNIIIVGECHVTSCHVGEVGTASNYNIL